MIVDNQKNQEKEIKLILQLLNAIKAKHTLSVQEAEEGKEAVFKRVEEKLAKLGVRTVDELVGRTDLPLLSQS